MIIHEREEIINKVKVIVATWLKTIGLGLQPSKPKLSHTYRGDQPGFAFLGFSIRQIPTKPNKPGYKLAIKTKSKV